MVGISNLFSQDLEDANFNKQVENLQVDNTDPNTTITQAQRKRLFAIAKTYSMGTVELKGWLKDKFGIESTNEITQKMYDEIVAKLQEEN